MAGREEDIKGYRLRVRGRKRWRGRGREGERDYSVMSLFIRALVSS